MKITLDSLFPRNSLMKTGGPVNMRARGAFSLPVM